jgi:hypothetical protein
MRLTPAVLAITPALLPLRSLASCDGRVYRQFDFWIGERRVTDARGKLLGHGGARRHQDFMDDGGFVLALDGSYRDGAMVLEGTGYVNVKPRLNRGVRSKRGSTVEEVWSISADGGRTWATKFDGWFHRDR